MSESTFMSYEQIKQLKARYFRYVDTHQFDALEDVFAKNAKLQWGPEDDQAFVGREVIIASLEANLKDATTIHHGHMPEIELIDDDHARGIWAMNDVVDHPDYLLVGDGHYHEDYVREDGVWKVARMQLTRLREERTPKS